MNKQELIDKLKRHLTVMSEVEGSEYDKGYKYATKQHLAMIAELYEPEKPVVPKYVADWLEVCKDNLALSLASSMNNIVMRTNNQPDKTIHWVAKNSETFAKAWIYGYEVEKEKLYIAKNKQTGEYLCYCFEFFHDKNSSSEDQRFTAEEKRWKELGYWDNDLYVFEEAEGEDE